MHFSTLTFSVYVLKIEGLDAVRVYGGFECLGGLVPVVLHYVQLHVHQEVAGILQVLLDLYCREQDLCLRANSDTLHCYKNKTCLLEHDVGQVEHRALEVPSVGPVPGLHQTAQPLLTHQTYYVKQGPGPYHRGCVRQHVEQRLSASRKIMVLTLGKL